MDDDPWKLLKDHLTLLLSALLTAVVGLRISAAAGGNPQTAWAILQETGTTSIVVASTISMAQIIVPVVFLLTFVAIMDDADLLGLPLPSPSIAFCSLGLLIFIAPLAELIMVLASSLLAVVLVLWRRTHPLSAKAKANGQNGRLEGIIAVLALLLLGTVLSPFWLPSERLDLPGGISMTRYVLSDENPDSLVVLDPRTKLVERVSDVENRSICTQEGSHWYVPLRQWMTDQGYPTCPSR